MTDTRQKQRVFLTPHKARLYLLVAAFLLALPSLSNLYKGYEGKLLVATGHAHGTFFEKTVIYVEDHDLFSAHGYVLNLPLRPDEKPELRSRFKGVKEWYIGGPVLSENTLAILLHNDKAIDIKAVADIQETEPGTFSALRQGEKDFKGFCGYAGWGPLQLNYEVLRGGWAVIDFDPELVLGTASDDLWEKAVERVQEQINNEDFI